MSEHSYEDILQRARKELSEAELRRLVSDLKKASSEQNGESASPSDVPCSIYDSMSRRGLIGKLTTAPADLSTNPAHMEGFGQDA